MLKSANGYLYPLKFTRWLGLVLAKNLNFVLLQNHKVKMTTGNEPNIATIGFNAERTATAIDVTGNINRVHLTRLRSSVHLKKNGERAMPIGIIMKNMPFLTKGSLRISLIPNP